MKILWVKTAPLHPLTRGGDLRTYHLLRNLCTNTHVTYATMAADQRQLEALTLAHEYSHHHEFVSEPKASFHLSKLGFCAHAARNLFSTLPFAVERFTSEKLKVLLRRQLQDSGFDLLLCDFLFPAASLPWELKAHTHIPWLLFQHNVESAIWQRRASNATGISGPYIRNQCHRMETFERNYSSKFDGVLTVSEDDTRVFRDAFGLTNVMGHIPTGVDVDYFVATPRSESDTPTVVFVGSMDWHANIDAVTFFAAECWPTIRRRFPGARFRIVGRNPSQEVSDLATPGNGIEVTGTVSDVRPYLRSAHAMIVPLRIGGGTRLKIFESMAAELPVVSTRIGAEGLPVTDRRHLLLADDADSFAKATIEMLESAELRDSIRKAAFNDVAQTFSWSRAADQMHAFFRQAIADFSSPQKRPAHHHP